MKGYWGSLGGNPLKAEIGNPNVRLSCTKKDGPFISGLHSALGLQVVPLKQKTEGFNMLGIPSRGPIKGLGFFFRGLGFRAT